MAVHLETDSFRLDNMQGFDVIPDLEVGVRLLDQVRQEVMVDSGRRDSSSMGLFGYGVKDGGCSRGLLVQGNIFPGRTEVETVACSLRFSCREHRRPVDVDNFLRNRIHNWNKVLHGAYGQHSGPQYEYERRH